MASSMAQSHCPCGKGSVLSQRRSSGCEPRSLKRIRDSPSYYSCNGSRRMVFINMTDTSHHCPFGLDISDPSSPIRTCGSTHNFASCSSARFSAHGMEYGNVCGRIKGYQHGETSAFALEMVDGVSLTHGSAGRRQHIWTFAAGFAAGHIGAAPLSALCPCDRSDNPNTAPLAFVGEDYFCETGNTENTNPRHQFFVNNPLWDGEGCGSNSTCCQFNNPPWFTKTLPAPTADDIELRLCHSFVHADTAIDFLELYVKWSLYTASIATWIMY